jgi:nucleotide-binding universal stress UspA family protein
MLPLAYDAVAVEAEAQRLLSETLAGWQDEYPDVKLERRLLHAHTRQALIDASHHAQLAVVGTRGYGTLSGAVLGSVSHAVLHHAACPVAIVRSTTPMSRPSQAR